MRTRLLSCLLMLCAAIPVFGQQYVQATDGVLRIPAPDRTELAREDAVTDRHKDIPWRFGKKVPVQVTQDHFVQWHLMHEGLRRTTMLDILASGAESINLEFSKFYLPEGTALIISTPDGTQQQSFSSKDNRPSGRLASNLFQGEKLELHLWRDSEGSEQPQIEISSVTYGYRTASTFLRGFNDSGPCQVNTSCPEADPWRQEVKSVCTILVSGNAFCTGALINNTCEDERPFVLTANHCLDGNEDIWVFRFNWESPDCAPTVQGVTNESVAGALVRASNASSDMALLELVNPIPDAYNAVFAGWDAGTSIPDSVAHIHHPSGDIKKLAIERDSVLSTSWNSVFVWKVGTWELGVTEPGSSGGPLFNRQGQIIGQLSGGDSDCGNPNDDYFGRMDVSWDQGGTAATQLENWLDACNTGATAMLSWPPIPTLALDGSAHALRGIESQVCGDSIHPVAVIRNSGLDTLTSLVIEYQLDINGIQQYAWTGQLLSGTTESVELPAMAVSAGNHTFEIATTAPNAGVDMDNTNDSRTQAFSVNTAGLPVRLRLQLDDFGSETQWRLESATGSVLYQGGPYVSTTGGEWVETAFCLAEECFKFRVLDSFGDGMSGAASGGLVNGHYTLLNSMDQELAATRATNFGFEETSWICPSATCTEGLPIPDFAVTAVPCKGDDTGEIFATATNGLPPYEYEWNDLNQQVGDVADGLEAGDYFCTVTDGLGCIYVGATTMIEADSVLELDHTVTDETDSLLDGSIAATLSGGATPYTYNWAHGANTAAIDSLARGWYILEAADSLGCVVRDSIFVNGPTGVHSIRPNNRLSLIPNPATDQCEIRVIGGAMPANVRIVDALGKQQLFQQIPTARGLLLELSQLPAGVYFVQADGAVARLCIVRL